MFNTLYKCETFYCFYKTMTLELFNIAMEYGPYVDDVWWSTYDRWPFCYVKQPEGTIGLSDPWTW
jgi:hypothetical protein